MILTNPIWEAPLSTQRSYGLVGHTLETDPSKIEGNNNWFWLYWDDVDGRWCNGTAGWTWHPVVFLPSVNELNAYKREHGL